MSISRRLINMARAELNSLLDRAAEADVEDDPDSDVYRRYSLDQISDQELEAELERRRRTREAAARAPRGTAAGASARPSARPSEPSGARASAVPSSHDEIRRAYAALEVPYGSDFGTVRKSYRALMRKYHPDRHTQSPEKQKTANELAQKLTDAYKRLSRHLRRDGR